MQSQLKDQIDWPQAFPADEYQSRIGKLREALAAQNLDAIYVTIPADITYLCGYDMIWYHLHNLIGLLVRADDDATVFFDGRYHTTIVTTTPAIGDVVWFEGRGVEDHIGTIVDIVKARGLAGGRIALQPWSYTPHATVMEALGDALRDSGATVVDGSFLVEEIRFLKSAREVEVMRKGAEIADAAMRAVGEAMQPGVIETELEAVIISTMMRAGCGYPGIRTPVGSGPRSGTHHGAATHRKLAQGDIVYIDFCSAYHLYHVDLCRTFSLGEPDPRWSDLMDRAAGCIDAILDGIECGDPLSRAQQLADEFIDGAGLRDRVWFIGGYSLGIGLPPDWCGNHWLSPTSLGMPDRAIEPGAVFNFENQFDVSDDWPGGNGAAYIETFLMTEDGLEVLSRLPRNLVVV